MPCIGSLRTAAQDSRGSRVREATVQLVRDVRRATYTVEPSIKDVDIDRRGNDILVTEQLLDRAYVLAPLQ